MVGKSLRMCFNKNVLIGLGVAVALVWWQAPGAVSAVLPLLVVAICPLSMLLMMRAMGGMNAQQPAEPPAERETADGGVMAPAAEQAPAAPPARSDLVRQR